MSEPDKTFTCKWCGEKLEKEDYCPECEFEKYPFYDGSNDFPDLEEDEKDNFRFFSVR